MDKEGQTFIELEVSQKRIWLGWKFKYAVMVSDMRSPCTEIFTNVVKTVPIILK